MTVVDRLDLQHPKNVWKWLRWGWLAIAVYGVLMIPRAVFAAIHVYQSDHRLGLLIPLGLCFQSAQICFFALLWWKTRPATSN
jgi:hypothetical protein